MLCALQSTKPVQAKNQSATTLHRGRGSRPLKRFNRTVLFVAPDHIEINQCSHSLKPIKDRSNQRLVMLGVFFNV